MIASTEHKLYKKMTKKGEGSILKAIRIDKGGGKGLIAGGIFFMIVALLFGVPLMIGVDILAGLGSAAFFGVPALILFAIGIPMKHKRETSWISYYQEKTGYSEGELQQIDRELASASTTIVTCRTPGAATENYIAGFFTEHYVLINGVYPYLRRLDDIIAVAFSDSTDIWSMASLTKLDEDTMAVGLFTDTQRKQTLCRELMQEMCRRNPNILCGQAIVCDGRHYILERDGAQLLRLYQEGRTLETAR